MQLMLEQKKRVLLEAMLEATRAGRLSWEVDFGEHAVSYRVVRGYQQFVLHVPTRRAADEPLCATELRVRDVEQSRTLYEFEPAVVDQPLLQALLAAIATQLERQIVLRLENTLAIIRGL